MAKQVKQFRFYQKDSAKNYPQNKVNYNNLITGRLFQDYMPVSQLGIQSLPGTKFYLNSSEEPVIIGHTGIYELDLAGLAEITALEFDSQSIEAIQKNNNAFLIVDIIYEQEDV